MKLLFCGKCNDIFNLSVHMKTCSCGNAKGKYINKVDAEYWGESVYPLGMLNEEVRKAIVKQPHQGLGQRYTAFVIPKKCPTMKKR